MVTLAEVKALKDCDIGKSVYNHPNVTGTGIAKYPGTEDYCLMLYLINKSSPKNPEPESLTFTFNGKVVVVQTITKVIGQIEAQSEESTPLSVK